MSHQSQRPSETNRTPQELAHACARLATAPLVDFGAFINDDARDQAYQSLLQRLTADWPNMLSETKAADVIDRLRGSTDDARALFSRYDSHRGDEAAIRENAAYLVGVEAGRQTSNFVAGDKNPAHDGLTPESRGSENVTDPLHFTETPPSTPLDDSPSIEGPSVEDVMLHVVSVLHLVTSIVDSQLGDVAEINPSAFYALRDLLQETATGLDAAVGRYTREYNAMHDATESAGAVATIPPAAPAQTPDAPDTDVEAAARDFLRRFGILAAKVNFGDTDESQRLLEAIPRGHGSQTEHTRWWDALEAIQAKYGLSFEEFDAVESGANGEALLSLEEGYVFGLAVGRQLRAEDVSSERAEPSVERTAQPAAG